MVANADTRRLTVEQLDREIVSQSFLWFLRGREDELEDGSIKRTPFVKILEPPNPGRTGGIIQFELWDHIVEAIEVIESNRLVNILKSRQLGFSWLLAAYALWQAQFKEGANVLAFSQGQLESTAFLRKSRTIHENLPRHLQIPLTRDNDTVMEFGSMKSKITALPSTESAGRGETATLVIQDEADFHENLELNYAAVKPTIDDGAQLIQCSTVNKEKPASLFKEINRAAHEGKNGFVEIFFGWRSRKTRDKKWWTARRAEVPATAGMDPDFYMEQEHPETREEALRPSRVMAAFDVEALDDMQNDVKRPVETRNNCVNIYQKPRVGRRYAAGSDTSHGVGADYSVTTIIDIEAGYVVADVFSNNLEPELFAFQSVELLKQYENPIWAIEDNEWGILTIRKAQDLRYPRLYEPRNHRGELTGKVGHHTGGNNRSTVWGELIEAVHDRVFIVPSRLGLSQFGTMIRNSEKDGRIEGMVGTNDDYPMACAIAWQMRKEAYTRDKKITVVTRAERMRRLGKTR